MTTQQTNPNPTGVGLETGRSGSLSSWAGDYVTNMLGRGRAEASAPYRAYQGPLTAGASPLQQQAFQGIAGLAMPTQQQMQPFTPTQFSAQDAGRLMNPYLQSALNPQIEQARRESQIQNLQNRDALTRSGALGGGRGALMEMESQRNLQSNLANITGQGYKSAYDQAMQQFNAEQEQRQQAAKAAQSYGLQALQQQADMGARQRDITQQGVEADYGQFKEQREYPYKNIQFMQSLLNGLPIAAQSYSYSQPSGLSSLLEGIGSTMTIQEKLEKLLGNIGGTTTPAK